MKNQFKILAFAAILLLTLAVCLASAIGANTLLGAANAAPMSLAAIAVLFRPNPTPPPLVPPTPTYDTQIHATFDPLSFDPDDPPVITFESANLPSYVSWNIEDEDGNPVIFPISSFPIVPGESYDTNSEATYIPGRNFSLALINEQEEVIYRCEIIIDNA